MIPTRWNGIDIILICLSDHFLLLKTLDSSSHNPRFTIQKYSDHNKEIKEIKYMKFRRYLFNSILLIVCLFDDLVKAIKVKNVVLIGGGHSHVYVLKNFLTRPDENVQVTLISREAMTPYSGMIPGYIAGLYTKEECHVNLVKLCQYNNIQFIHAEAIGIDTISKEVILSDHSNDNKSHMTKVSYDILSINTGSTPKPIPNKHTKISPPICSQIIPVKPISTFTQQWEHTIASLLNQPTYISSECHHPYRLAIIGGGAGGVELTFAIHSRLITELRNRGRSIDEIEVILITRSSRLLPHNNIKASNIVTRIMADKGIKIQLNTEIAHVENTRNENRHKNNNDNNDNSISLSATTSTTTTTSAAATTTLISSNGDKIEVDKVFWCVQASALSWFKETGLDTTKDGFIRVQDTLESMNIPDIFACGDCCEIMNAPRPKAGVFAVRAGPPLLNNILRKLRQQPLESWQPQTEFLSLIGTFGDGKLKNSDEFSDNKNTLQTTQNSTRFDIVSLPSTNCTSFTDMYAIAARGNKTIEGAHLWITKDTIDRTWMKQYTTDLDDNIPRITAIQMDNTTSTEIDSTSEVTHSTVTYGINNISTTRHAPMLYINEDTNQLEMI